MVFITRFSPPAAYHRDAATWWTFNYGLEGFVAIDDNYDLMNTDNLYNDSPELEETSMVNEENASLPTTDYFGQTLFEWPIMTWGLMNLTLTIKALCIQVVLLIWKWI
jgi:hypothetical protein